MDFFKIYRGRRRDDELRGNPAHNSLARSNQCGKHVADFLATAAGEQSDRLAFRVQVKSTQEFLPIHFRGEFLQKGMPHKFHAHSTPAIIVFLEGKNHKHMIHIVAHCADPPTPPSPYLRAYVVDHFDSGPSQFFRQTQVELGEIH